MPDRIEPFKVLCGGGWNSNENHLRLAEMNPGAATLLVNYEPGLYGGYRRIEGYEAYDTDYPEVGAGSAEGPILCATMFQDDASSQNYVLAARKDIGANTYTFYKHVPGVGWSALTTGLTQSTTDGVRTVNRIRHVQFDFSDGNKIAFVDGVNNAIIFDGSTWYQLSSAGAGTSADPGGPQIVDAPAIVDVFENHLFFGADRASKSVVCYGSPNNPFDFTSASGAGQITTGFNVVQFKPFRDQLFVFGPNSIKKIQPDVSAGFVIEQVTTNVGCVARDSVMEVGGDLVFMSPDGLRPVAGTARIGDVEIETISGDIKGHILEMLNTHDPDDLVGVVVRKKSQARFFFDDDATEVSSSIGILAGLSRNSGELIWEFAETRGIRANCASSEQIGNDEYVLHGDFDGVVYQQETGESFNGSDIVAIYSTPFLDFGDTELRKVIHKVNTFIRAEGPFSLNLSVSYDWADQFTSVPAPYEQTTTGTPSIYGGREATYSGTDVQYGGTSKPVMMSDVQGSGFSVRLTYVTFGQTKPHSIQGLVIEYGLAGRR